MSVHAVCITVPLRPRDQKWNRSQHFGSMETGAARVPLGVGEHSDRALFLVPLWAAKRVSWGILFGPGQREAEVFFSFSLWEIAWCRSQRNCICQS